jgi:hypothetical protein
MELGSGNNVEVSGFVVFFSFYLITFSPNLSKNMSTYFAVVTIYTWFVSVYQYFCSNS